MVEILQLGASTREGWRRAGIHRNGQMISFLPRECQVNAICYCARYGTLSVRTRWKAREDVIFHARMGAARQATPAAGDLGREDGAGGHWRGPGDGCVCGSGLSLSRNGPRHITGYLQTCSSRPDLFDLSVTVCHRQSRLRCASPSGHAYKQELAPPSRTLSALISSHFLTSGSV